MSTTAVTAPPEHLVDAGSNVDPHHERRWLILLLVSLAQLMILVDATIINVALPSAQRARHFERVLGHATVHGYQTAFWWSAGIFWSASLRCGALVRSKNRMHATDAEVIEELAEVVPAL